MACTRSFWDFKRPIMALGQANQGSHETRAKTKQGRQHANRYRWGLLRVNMPTNLVFVSYPLLMRES